MVKAAEKGFPGLEELPVPICIRAQATYKRGMRALKKFNDKSLNFLINGFKGVLSPHLCVCLCCEAACNGRLSMPYPTPHEPGVKPATLHV